MSEPQERKLVEVRIESGRDYQLDSLLPELIDRLKRMLAEAPGEWKSTTRFEAGHGVWKVFYRRTETDAEIANRLRKNDVARAAAAQKRERETLARLKAKYE
jgi:hypothetical protein